MHPTFQPGDMLAGRYRIREALGSGTIGSVYRALDMGINTEVALKVIGPDMLPDVAARRTFIQVVRRAQAVDHPNLARILDVRQDGDFALVCTQLLEGLSLRRLLTSRKEKRHRMPPEEVRPILEQVAEALTTAHPDVCHGCLKPEDIVLLPDHVKVLDLGMVAGLPRETFLAAYRKADGPLAYLAPELRARMSVTPRADVYSLGVVVYEMLTSVAPLETPRSVRTFDENLPAAYDEIIRRALSMDPAQRYRAPEGLVADFVAVIENRPLGPPPSGAPGAHGFSSFLAGSPPVPAAEEPRAPLPSDSAAPDEADDRDELWGFTERTPAPAPPPRAAVVAEVEMPMLRTATRPLSPPALEAPPEAPSEPAAMTPAAPEAEDPEWIDSATLSDATPPPHAVALPSPSEPQAVLSAPVLDAAVAAPPSPDVLEAEREPLPLPPASLPPPDQAPLVPEAPPAPPQAPRATAPLAPARTTGAPLAPAEVTQRVLGLRRASLAAWVAGSLAVGLIAAGLVYQVVRARRTDEADETQRRLYERQRIAQTPPPEPVPATPPEPPPPEPPPSPAPLPDTAPTEPPTPAPATGPRTACPEGMKLIASKRTDAYCIDKYEYPGVAIPRVDVSWEAADAACHERGARLCGPGEWERACRGPRGADYPYGEPWDPLACNTASAEGAPRGVLNSGAQRGCRSSQGIYDMSGNVAEWVSNHAARGGSSQSGEADSRCSSSAAGAASKFVGFRCCADATQE